MIITGVGSTELGRIETEAIFCEHCEQECVQEITVYGYYFRVFFIPIFPVGKRFASKCSCCNAITKRITYSDQLKSEYPEYKENIKRPFWHWIGSVIIGSLIALIVVTVSVVDIESIKDPRADLLIADIHAMNHTPTMESDSVSYKIKKIFEEFLPAKFKLDRIEYLSKVKGSNGLVLVKIPDLKDIEKSERNEVIALIELVTKEQLVFSGRKMYIGVHGQFTMMMIKTPNAFENGRFIFDDPINDFYGPELIKEEKQ